VDAALGDAHAPALADQRDANQDLVAAGRLARKQRCGGRHQPCQHRQCQSGTRVCEPLHVEVIYSNKNKQLSETRNPGFRTMTAPITGATANAQHARQPPTAKRETATVKSSVTR